MQIKENPLRELLYQLKRNYNSVSKINLVWLELTGCSGNIISFLNALNPDVSQLLNEKINLLFSNSLMVAEGDFAMAKLYQALEVPFILVVEGAVATKAGGLYNIIGRYQNTPVTALDAVTLLGAKATDIMAVGTCASYGGPSSAAPNPSACISVPEAVVNKMVIKLPGCPSHPDWLIGTLVHLMLYGRPHLDEDNRPTLFYERTIHENCTRRSYFDRGIFANKLSENTCMFKLGCKGPITKADCPTRQWNGYINWPVGANTPCIGCANRGFPDGTEPFIKYPEVKQ